MKAIRTHLFLLLSIVFISTALPAEITAKDTWVSVRSKNFHLIGNASEKEIRRVGARMEQFRETFRLLFSNMKLTGAVPTNVVVFKNDGAYRPFKPKRGDGKIDTEIAGFFQPGEDVNYITLAAGGDEAGTFGTIFHEYVHWILDTNFGKSEVPSWFNEGLAEFYQTFEISDDIRAKLGLPQAGHINLLQQSKMMPLSDLLKLTQYQVLQTGGHSRSIFYAQSWAFVHYLMLSGKQKELSSYLSMVTGGATPDVAFEKSFATDYAKMEAELRKYVQKSSYLYTEYKFKQKLAFDTEMTSAQLDDASVAAYLGDLLYHTNRSDDAEPYLIDALRLKPDHSMANSALGMVRFRQRRFDDARSHLERAIEADHQSHVAYYNLAFLLSREGRDEFGFVQRFEPEVARKMRDALKKAININPGFTGSYELYAFVNLVNNEGLDEALAMLQDALTRSPGNPKYALRAAEIYFRQNKLSEAESTARHIELTTEEPDLRSRAQALLKQIAQRREFDAAQIAQKERYNSAVANSGTPPKILTLIDRGTPPSTAEIAKMQAEQNVRAINEALRQPKSTEERVIGRIQNINCKKRPITITVKTLTGEILSFGTKDFESLTLNSLAPEAAQAMVGCDLDLSKYNAVLTHVKTSLTAIEFVPGDFRLMSAEELAMDSLVVYDDDPSPTGRNPEEFRREQILAGIRASLRKPADGETQEIGLIDRIECTKGSYSFYFRTDLKTYRLSIEDPRSLSVRIFTPDLDGLRLQCGSKAIDNPVVFTFKKGPDQKGVGSGNVIALEFLPKGFKL